ncbi:MAG: tRNA pseudouridine(13) synthase TruD [Gammaproteobacteria bacterium]
MTATPAIPQWPCAFGGPPGRGDIRLEFDDFSVHERLSFEPSGEGEHVYLQIEKRGENTEYIARTLARFAGVNTRDVGYAGLKDRAARTVQWFSVWIPGRPDPDWTRFSSESVEILQAVRHPRKLKRGALAGNDFSLLIGNWRGTRETTEAVLNQLSAHGMPNYFGPQRFGIDGRNVAEALAMFGGRRAKPQLRSIYLSTARSYLFNRILAERVRRGDWNLPIPGDAFLFDRSGSFFRTARPDEAIQGRVERGEIHPSGALWGIGEPDVCADALAVEQKVINENADLARGLERFKVEMARRPLRVNIENLNWRFYDETELRVNFSLPPGSYATSVLREIIE